MPVKALSIFAVSVALCACSGSTGGTDGGSTGAGGSSSATTTGAGSSSGGASGNGICVHLPSLPDAGACTSGSYESQVVDLLTCAPIVGATVQALNSGGVPVSGSVATAADGTFVLCGPAGSAFTPFFMAEEYATTYYPELQAGGASSLSYLDLVTSDDLSAIGAFAPGGFDGSKGTLIVHMNFGAACPNPAGWSFTLTAPDGGAISDGGYLETYLGASGVPESTLTATTKEGVALFYDIDTSATNYFGLSWSNPDAGGCAPVLATAFYTGRIYIQADSVTFYILQVP